VLLVGVLDIHDYFGLETFNKYTIKAEEKVVQSSQRTISLILAEASAVWRVVFLIYQPSRTRNIAISMISVDAPT